jgi:flagellar assembly protein FliH
MQMVIEKDQTEGHLINKYKFKVLSNKEAGEHLVPSENVNEESENTGAVQDMLEADMQPQEEIAIRASSKDEMIESLLKKTDEMTSNFIKMQMKLESKEELHKTELEKAKQEAFNEGMAAGKKEFEEQQKASNEENQKRFESSIQKLEVSALEYKHALEKIKKELLEAAADIAKEVIAVELGEDSLKVAKKLSDELINELQNAAKISIKVSPVDFTALSEMLSNLKNVKVSADRAISPGGVVATSDVGNIDAQIVNRYERVKKTALQED